MKFVTQDGIQYVTVRKYMYNTNIKKEFLQLFQFLQLF